MKKKSLLEKLKGLSKGKKIALGLGTVLLIGALATPTEEKPVNASENKPKIEAETKKDNKEDKAEEKADENQVMYDKNGIKITFKGIENDLMGKAIKLNIENNTDGKKTIQVRDLSINGYMIDGIFSPTIEAGKKANDKISLLKTYLEENDIENIESIELKFAIIDSNDIFDTVNTEIIKVKL
ncbi:hypothetical protein [uncultured Clostridium sp.]|uniref:hypothetical protein n=1 Tax=uncultured Clostridium sp. TaxID=59620 RepID=UPI00260EED29|nr:hypothetical protein [uncultured Clostridium sp.]